MNPRLGRPRTPLGVAAAGRRYVGLTALRWLPVGVTAPVTVLLAAARGLSAADIGVVFAVHSVVALTLELPTGGLADAIGRRPVLVLSAVLHAAGVLTLVVAPDALTFAVAFALVGAGRALDSGPLESWYVDAVAVLDPGADVTPGLSRAAVASGAGLAVGAVAGGLVPTLAATSEAALVLPLLLAAGIDAAYLAAVLVLVRPVTADAVVAGAGAESRAAAGAAVASSAAATVRAGVRAVPGIVRDAGQLAATDPVLRRILAITFLTGTVLSGLELLGPLRFAELTGSRTQGTAAYGIVMAVSFAVAALGAALATTARRAAGGSPARASAVLFLACAVAVTGVAAASTVVLAGVAFAAFYLANAAGWPLRQQLLHARVDASLRSTTVSAKSFALMTGGIVGNLLLPRLAAATGYAVALGAAAVPLVLAAVISTRLPSAARFPGSPPLVPSAPGGSPEGAESPSRRG